MLITARHYQTHEPIEIQVAAGRISAVRALGNGQSRGAESHLPWIAPGFVDVQINGYGGHDLTSLELTPEKVVEVVRLQNPLGVTRFCPTVVTSSFEMLAHSMRAIAAAYASSSAVAHRMLGIHLEGPYIATEDGPRGAHPLQHCRPPDWNEFQRLQEAAGGLIRLVTLSAEYPQSVAFIARAVAGGVTVAIGHMNANSDQVRAAIDAGATLGTHLGNGCHRSIRRHPNYIWDQLADDRLTVSLIVDGHHLPAEVVKTFVRAKTPARCILVSDVTGMAGLPPGRYSSWLCDVELLPSGRLVVAGQDQLLAGASLPIGVCVANVMRFAGVDLATAVDMASVQAAALLKAPSGRLAPGDPADLVVFDLSRADDGLPDSLEVRATIAGGELVFGSV